MEKFIPVETDELGVLRGRDCIFLDSVQENDIGDLVFKGEINGSLLEGNNTKYIKNYIKYSLTFKSVMAYFACELDTYFNLFNSSSLSTSSFDLIDNSKWLQSLPIKQDIDKSIYKHYRLVTYDRVYDIVAASYNLEIRDVSGCIE